MQHGRQIFDVDEPPVRVEHLDEAAHVRALEILGQIDQQADPRHGVLRLVCLVAHLDRVEQALHAHLVDAQLARIGLALAIGQRRRGGLYRRRFQRYFISSDAILPQKRRNDKLMTTSTRRFAFRGKPSQPMVNFQISTGESHARPRPNVSRPSA